MIPQLRQVTLLHPLSAFILCAWEKEHWSGASASEKRGGAEEAYSSANKAPQADLPVTGLVLSTR